MKLSAKFHVKNHREIQFSIMKILGIYVGETYDLHGQKIDYNKCMYIMPEGKFGNLGKILRVGRVLLGKSQKSQRNFSFNKLNW